MIAIGSGGRAFGSYQRAGERYALAAFGSTAEASIGAARGIGAAPHGFLQILFANGIADTDDHEALPKSGISQMIMVRNRILDAVANLLRFPASQTSPQPF